MTDNTAMVLMTLIFFAAPCVIVWIGVKHISKIDKKDDEK